MGSFYDVIFSPGETYALTIDTNLYAGNFEREICEYCTGIYNLDIGSSFRSKDNPGSDPEMVKSFQNISSLVNHQEYGPVVETLYSSHGKYTGIAIFLCEMPTLEQVEYVRERALLFAQTVSHGEEKMIVKDVCVTRIEMLQVENRVVPKSSKPTLDNQQFEHINQTPQV